jgi:hypothetical protein
MKLNYKILVVVGDGGCREVLVLENPLSGLYSTPPVWRLPSKCTTAAVLPLLSMNEHCPMFTSTDMKNSGP